MADEFGSWSVDLDKLDQPGAGSTLAELDEALAHLNLPPRPESLPVPTTDAHTHAGSTTEYSKLTLEYILAAARSVNVTRIVEVGTDVDSSRAAIALAETHPGVVAAVAIHPNDAARLGARLPAELAALEALVGSSSRVRGVGETGLDYFRTKDPAGQTLQKARGEIGKVIFGQETVVEETLVTLLAGGHALLVVDADLASGGAVDEGEGHAASGGEFGGGPPVPML